MKFVMGCLMGVILATGGQLLADDYLLGYPRIQAPQTGTFTTPDGRIGSFQHNPSIGQTWIQDSDGNATYLYTPPGRRNPC